MLLSLAGKLGQEAQRFFLDSLAQQGARDGYGDREAERGRREGYEGDEQGQGNSCTRWEVQGGGVEGRDAGAGREISKREEQVKGGRYQRESSRGREGGIKEKAAGEGREGLEGEQQGKGNCGKVLRIS